MFPATNLGRVISIFAALIGTIINSLVTASVINLLQMNNNEESSYRLNDKLGDKTKLTELYTRYLIKCSAVSISKRNYLHDLRKNLSTAELKKNHYVEALKEKLSLMKRIKFTRLVFYNKYHELSDTRELADVALRLNNNMQPIVDKMDFITQYINMVKSSLELQFMNLLNNNRLSISLNKKSMSPQKIHSLFAQQQTELESKEKTPLNVRKISRKSLFDQK